MRRSSILSFASYETDAPYVVMSVSKPNEK